MKIKSKHIIQENITEAIKQLIIFHINHPEASPSELNGEMKTILRRIDSFYALYKIKIYFNKVMKISKIFFTIYNCDENYVRYINDSVEACNISKLYDDLMFDSLISKIYEYNFSR